MYFKVENVANLQFGMCFFILKKNCANNSLTVFHQTSL